MSKHMDLSDRQRVETGINAKENFSQIAKAVGKSRSTITREIRAHRIPWKRQPYGRIQNRCVNRYSCNLKHLCDPECNRKCCICPNCCRSCGNYIEEHCAKLNEPPYVCNSCPDLNKCPLEKFRYDSVYAQNEYRSVLSESREGFNLSDEDLHRIDELISPLICSGQSVHHAVLACKDQLPVGDRTVYRLTDKSALKARNIDLPRKCKLKPRKGVRPKRKIDKACRAGRTYADYCSYIAAHPDILPVQMDTVVGCEGSSKVLLTFWFCGNFMPAFLREGNTSASVLEWIDFLYNGLGHDDFCTLFPVILTDNGTEFSDPSAIETAPDGRQRTKVFYCDPLASFQKPQIECCHEMFRRILPKGTSFDALSQNDIALIASHVNSYARTSLSDKTPIDALTFNYGSDLTVKLLHLLCLKKIDPPDIVLLPTLLNR